MSPRAPCASSPAALWSARLTLLGGPTALAFFAGGYFPEPQLWSALAVWALVGTAALLAPRPFPLAAPGRIAIVSLAALTALSAASVAWAPVAGSAWHDTQRLMLYLGALVAAVALLHGRRALRALEPACAAGALVVVGYGLSERLLPGVITLTRDASADGRLDQPLTYWNAMGVAAAVGLVLAARLAGDPSRSRRLRVAGAAAVSPLALGLYVSFSRGALFACAAGILALGIAAATGPQLRAVALAAASATATVALCASWRGVTALSGPLATREREGALALAGMAAVALAAAAAQAAAVRREARAGPAVKQLALPRWSAVIAASLVLAGLGVFAAVGARERTPARLTPGAHRLASLHSNRYAYWRVALRAFEAEPLRGQGAGAFGVYWLRHRPFAEAARDAHSLPIQTAAELGIAGVGALIALLAAAVVSARRAHALAPGLAAGPIAALAVLGSHTLVDWDWQLPAVTLTALVLLGALVALADLTVPAR